MLRDTLAVEANHADAKLYEHISQINSNLHRIGKNSS
jgi:hypothetical protein